MTRNSRHRQVELVFAPAERLYGKALEATERHFGRDHWWMARTLRDRDEMRAEAGLG